MTNTVLLKRSATANSAPSAGSLLYGELAINYADGNLYYLNSANAVTVIASNKTISLSGNITAGNILTGGLISATGNITSAGNVNAREMTVTGNSLNTYAVDITGNLRAHLLNIDDLFVSNITLYNQLTGNGGNIAITSSNVNVGGAISATGNITGKYFLGNANIQYTASTAPTTGNLIGAQWYNTSTDALYEWQTDGTSTYWVDITGPVVGTTGGATGNVIVNGTSNVTIPTANGNAGINIGGTANIAIFATTGAYITGVVSANGNIAGGNLNATGLSLSGNVISAINTTANITTTANISGGNILGTHVGNVTGTTASLSANITGGNLLTSGLISATGNITGGNILGGSNVNATTHTGTTVSVSANVTGGNLLTSGLISATGNISANNATFTSNLGVGTTPGSGVRLDVLGGEIKAGRIDSNNEGGQVSFGRATDNATAWYLDVYGNTSTPSLRFVDVSSGAVSMNINSSGAVALRGAVSATGVGITFPATQSASSDANTLDDYEEGTWTPVLQFDANTQTTTTPIATYVKVGKSVTINMQIAWAAKSGSGRVYITGLPFAKEAGGTVPLLAGCPAGSVTTGAAIFYNVDGGGTILNLAEQAGDINSASLAASGSLFCSGTYFV